LVYWTAAPRADQTADTKADCSVAQWVEPMAGLTVGAKVDWWAVLRAVWKADGKADCSAATLDSVEHHILHTRNPRMCQQ